MSWPNTLGTWPLMPSSKACQLGAVTAPVHYSVVVRSTTVGGQAVFPALHTCGIRYFNGIARRL